MYRLGKRTHKKHLLLTALAVVILLLGSGIFAYKALHLTATPRTQIQNKPAVTRHYDPSSAAKVPIDQTLFSIDLPHDWKAATAPDSFTVRPTFYAQSSSVDARQLAVYIDELPTTLAVNRVVIVSALSNTVQYDAVSDNCSGYAQPSKVDQDAGRTSAKWKGIDFLCDIGNYKRDVVGTTSKEAINKLTLTGQSGKTHAVFFTYTDNSSSPDFSVFYQMLASFRLK